MAQADSISSRSHPHLRLASIDGEIILVRAGHDNDNDSIDCELFLLRDELRAVCDALNDDPKPSQGPALVSRLSELARQIALMRAQTIAGLKVKASALQWVYLGDGYFEPLDFQSAQGRLYISLLNDLHRFDDAAVR